MPSGRGRAAGEGEGEADVGVARQVKATHPLPAAAASDLPRCAGEVIREAAECGFHSLRRPPIRDELLGAFVGLAKLPADGALALWPMGRILKPPTLSNVI